MKLEAAGIAPSNADDPPPRWAVGIVSAAIFAAFIVAAVLIFVQQFEAAWDLRLGDSDNYMRLAEVRDLLAGQGWFDMLQHRVNPPAGLHSHWSRLADLPYVLPILLLRLFMSAELAERLTIVTVPPLLLLLTMIATARLADRLAGGAAAVCTALLLIVAPQVLAQFVPGRIDHHGLQILLLVVTVSSAAGPDRLRHGSIAALGAALSLAVGLETAPYLAAVAAWMAVRWIVAGDEVRGKTLGFFVGLTVAVPLLFFLTVPAADWPALRTDALGLGHVIILVTGSLAWAASAAATSNRPFGQRSLAGGVAALVGLIASLRYPGLLSDPYAGVDPLLRHLWIDNLSETRSIAEQWARSPAVALAEIWFVASSAVAALVLAIRSRDRWRDNFLLLGLLALIGIVLTIWQLRANAMATSVAIPTAAAFLARLWARWRRHQASVLPLAAAALALNPILVVALASVLKSGSGTSARPRAMNDAGRCDQSGDFAPLERQPPGLILGPIDQSATLLVRTNHRVLAAPNHRNAAENGLVYRILTTTPEAAAPLAQRLRVDFVVFCPNAPEVANLVRFSPHGLVAQLRAGHVPDWLEPVPGGRGGLVVLRTRWAAGSDREGAG
jgi:asparagine N-glycosylation enzyme membrane subunit Stt3